MLQTIQKKGKGVRILLTAVFVFIALSMLISLLPGTITPPEASADAVVEIDGKPITALDVRRQLQQVAQGRQMPPAIEALYSRQILDQMVSDRLLELEATRQGVAVTRQEQADRIRLLLPSAKAGDMQRYPTEVLERFQMTVSEFEEAVRKSILTEKFAQVITDGVSVSPEEVGEEFRRRNEKIKIEFALIKPDDLESKVAVSESDLAAHFEKNKATYQVPERRTIRYALLDAAAARARVSVSEAELRANYDQNIDAYRLQDRARVSHILLKTVGKTDAEVEEIRQRAADLVKKLRGGAKFEDLAKQHSEDTTKDKGGDLGWIVPGQTVEAFGKAAFSLPLKTISDPVKTEYGFHIIRVGERESARTRTFEEVRGEILPALTTQKADRIVSDLADKLSSTVRQNSRVSLEELAKQFPLTLGEAGPAGVRESFGPLGASPELDDAVFRLREAEIGGPVQLAQGHAVLTLKKAEPAHQGTLAEVRERVTVDVRRDKAADLARKHAEDIAVKAKGGNLSTAAKGAGIAVKASEPFARNGSIPDVGSAKALSAAFSMNPNDVSGPVFLGANWVVFKLLAKEAINPVQMITQMREVQDSLLQSKRQVAFDAFRDAVRDRWTKEGKVKFNQENLRRLTEQK
jgi:peptidyl-prolyl cis-trans isomerase D